MSTQKSPLQFSLRTIFGTLLIVSVFFGLFANEQYLILYLFVLASSLVLMIYEIAMGKISRFWSSLLLAVALVYAAGNIEFFAFMLSVDPFGIFDPVFIFFAVLGMPFTVCCGVIVAAVYTRKIHWTGIVGICLWMSCVGFANLYVIAECSAAV